MRRVGPGSPEPLGLTLVPGGANIAVYSAHASAIQVCLFDAGGQTEVERIALPEKSGDVFHGFVSNVRAGDRYGLRAHGPYDPRNGHRFNAAKLLVDPYVTAIDRRFTLHPSMFGELPDGLTRNDDDSAPYVPKGIASFPADARHAHCHVPWETTVLYELHVRGYTKRNPQIAEALRGTCAGLAHPAAIDYLTRLGITTVELMPIAAVVDERHLARHGLRNYWGYNPAALFVPEPLLAPGGIAELRACVAALHAAGIEVIQDMVLNHTGEGDALGPTLSWRGLDNATYYRSVPGDASRYVDDTGTGNTLALDRPPVLRLAMDVLRYYAAVGIDGFRFDLATTLGRREDGFDRAAPLLQAIAADPALRDLKLIAEPWDPGPGGYQLGAFPADWGEWNDRYRDTARRFWRGDRAIVADLATRLAGSADVFATGKPGPSRSINFIAAHDGFTLADLVSYEQKHNEDNRENNRDGTDANFSWNHGVEGSTGNVHVRDARARDARSLLATLLVSRGTPMLAMGDELGRTQHGNNNAYAQDNVETWIDWDNADDALSTFTAHLIDLRRRHRALFVDRWLTGAPIDDSGIPDVEWRHPGGHPMTTDDWTRADNHALVAAFYAAATADSPPDRVVIAFNAGDDSVTVHWPNPRNGFAWRRVIDTAQPTGRPDVTGEFVDGTASLGARSVLAVVEEGSSSPRHRHSGVEPEILKRLAAAAGIAADWWDISGGRHIVSSDTTHALLDAMGLTARSTGEARDHLAMLAVARERRRSMPTAARCFLPAEFRAGKRFFGLAAHLYALRREGDQGIGDFSTLARIAAATARAGGVTVAINPLHALFAQDRERASPYHPSDRRFLDPIYIDVDRVPDLQRASGACALQRVNSNALAELSARATVDYTGVWQHKHAVLEACFTAFEQRIDADPLVTEFRRFVAEGGEELRQFALFEAIAAAYPNVPWQRWPTDMRRPNGSAITEFAHRSARRIRFALYLQWLADRQLAEAAKDARSSGLALGLYRDLAVGAAPDGAESWINGAAGLVASGVSIGAPPDPFATAGQVWHLPPPNPIALAASDYAAFRALIASNMRHAGALRIDHVMGLTRLFWIPDGAAATEGAYVHYPLDDLLGVVASESIRARCVVVGEDLGTVPEGFRERLDAADVLSYRVLWFEREGIAFKPPSHYAAKAVACTSTHDLPTIAGWWLGADIEEKRALKLIAEADVVRARADRFAEKQALTVALDQAGVAQGAVIDAAAPYSAAIPIAIHRFVCASQSTLMLIQADDLAEENAAINLPGTDRERPNWRRKVSIESHLLWQTAVGAQAVVDFAGMRGVGGDYHSVDIDAGRSDG
jgi:glycogen operon protein